MAPSRFRSMRPPLHRGMVAVAVSVLFGIVGLGGAGFASDAPASPDVLDGPFLFTLPSPQVGDRGEYAAVDADGNTRGVVEGATGTFTFEWLPDHQMFAAEGTHHLTNRLVTEEPAMLTMGVKVPIVTRHIDQATKTVIAVGTMSPDEANVEQLPGGTTETHHWVYNGTSFAREADRAPMIDVPCGLLHPLQGLTASTEASLVLPHGCFRPMEHNYRAGATVPPATLVHDVSFEHDGHTYHRYNATTSDADQEGTGRLMSLTFRQDLPYPVEIHFTVANRDDDSAPRHLVLIDFARGTGAALGSEASTAPPLPALEWVRPPVWGLDDEGIDHPYPLSDAFAQARDDPRDARLRDFLDTHGDAHGVEAWFWEYERDAERFRQWHIEVASGDASERLLVCPYQKHATIDDTELDVHIPYDTLADTFPCELDDRIQRPAHDPDRQRPTVRSMQAVWDRVAPLFGHDGPAFAYEFYLWHNHDDPSNPWHSVSIGIDHIPTMASDLVTADDEEEIRERKAFSLRFDEDGALLDFSADTYVHKYERNGSDGSSMAPSSGDDARAITPVWNLPDPRTTAAVGAFAAGLGFLYWLWPHVARGGAVMLFSRIRRPAVLDNARRAQVAEAIAAAPGIHLSQLQRVTGLASGQLRHHLGKLEETDVVTKRRIGRNLCYFRKDMGEDVARLSRDPEVRIKNETARRAYALVAADPGRSWTGAAIAERLGVSRQAAHPHLKRLVEDGFLIQHRSGASVTYQLRPGTSDAAAVGIGSDAAADVAA